MPLSEICYSTASELAGRIRSKKLSCLEVMKAFLTRIEQVNPKVNAIVTQISTDHALALAQAADDAIARGIKVGPLHGLPIAHKDLVPTKGEYGPPPDHSFTKTTYRTMTA